MDTHIDRVLTVHCDDGRPDDWICNGRDDVGKCAEFIITKAFELSWLTISQLKFPNGTLLETSVNETMRDTILEGLFKDKPPEKVTMPNNITISPDWNATMTLISMAIVPSSPGSKNGTMLYEQCLNIDEMGIFYADAYLDPRPLYKHRDAWFASDDYRYNDISRQKLLTKYPAASCLNRYMLGIQELSELPQYSANMTWWSDKNNFRCLPSTDYAWVSTIDDDGGSRHSEN